MVVSSNPLQRGSQGWCGISVHQNHVARGGNGSIMVEMFVCLCLASQNLSEGEFFVPTRTDLSVKLAFYETGPDSQIWRVQICNDRSQKQKRITAVTHFRHCFHLAHFFL